MPIYFELFLSMWSVWTIYFFFSCCINRHRLCLGNFSSQRIILLESIHWIFLLSSFSASYFYVCTLPFVCHNWYMFGLSHNRRARLSSRFITSRKHWHLRSLVGVHGRYCCAFASTHIFRYRIANIKTS